MSMKVFHLIEISERNGLNVIFVNRVFIINLFTTYLILRVRLNKRHSVLVKTLFYLVAPKRAVWC